MEELSLSRFRLDEPINKYGSMREGTFVVMTRDFALLDHISNDKLNNLISLSPSKMVKLNNDLKKFSFKNLLDNGIALESFITAPKGKVCQTYVAAITGPIATAYEDAVMFLSIQFQTNDFFPLAVQFLVNEQLGEVAPHHPMIKSDGSILNHFYDASSKPDYVFDPVMMLKKIRDIFTKKYSQHKELFLRIDRVSECPKWWTAHQVEKARIIAGKHGEYNPHSTEEIDNLSTNCQLPNVIFKLIVDYFIPKRCNPREILSNKFY